MDNDGAVGLLAAFGATWVDALQRGKLVTSSVNDRCIAVVNPNIETLTSLQSWRQRDRSWIDAELWVRRIAWK
jgi:hypothetical protein